MSEESRSTSEPGDDFARERSEPDFAAQLFRQLGPHVVRPSVPNPSDPLAQTVIGSGPPESGKDDTATLSVPGLPARYEVRHELSRGGQGRVMLAWDSDAKREVAIKLLLRASDQDMALLHQECEMLARIDHPGIVRLLDIGRLTSGTAGTANSHTADATPPVGAKTATTNSPTGTPYLVLEFVQGQPLDRYVKERKPPVREILRIVACIAEAVGKAHSLKITHRDLKPANVLMTEAGEPKVLDFGLSQDDGSRTKSILQGGIAGTWSYMSPEQSLGKPTGAATDVYALGVTLYQLLTETLPIPLRGSASDPAASLSVAQIQERIGKQPPMPLRERDKSLPRELDDICDRCLCKAADDRYATAGALADDLQRFLNHEPVSAWRGWRVWRGRDICFGWRGPYVATKYVRRNSWLVTLASLVVISVAVGFWQVTLERNEAVFQKGIAQTNEKRANEQTRLAQDNEKQAEQNRKLAEAARDESESRRFRLLVDSADRAITARQFHDARYFLLDAETRGTTWETARLKFEAGAERFTSLRLAEHHWGLTAAVLNPDRSRLVSAAADGALVVWDMKSGRVCQTLNPGELRDDGRLRRHCAVSVKDELLAESTPFVTGLCWLGDSDKFVATSFDGSASIYSLTQPEVHELPARPASLYSIAADVRGESILMGDGRGGVSLWKVTGDEVRLASEATVAKSPITAIVCSSSGTHWFVGTEQGEVLVLIDSTLAVRSRLKLVEPIMGIDAPPSNGPSTYDLLAVASGQASTKILAFSAEPDQLTELTELSLPKLSQQVHCVRWDREGHRLLAVDDQGQLLEWDTEEFVLSVDVISHFVKSPKAEGAESRVRRIPVPLLRATRAIGAPDNNPHRDPKRTAPLPLPLRRRATVLLPLNKEQVLVGGEDVVLRVWDEPSAPDRTKLSVGQQPRLTFDPQRPTRLWAATGDGKLALHETGGPAPHAITQVEAHRGAITGLVALPKARLVATAGRDGAVRLWQHDAKLGLVAVGESISHDEPLLSLAVSHHEKWLAAVDATNRLIVWNVASRMVERELEPDNRDRSEPLTGAVAFNADDTRLAALGAGQTSSVFNTAGFAKLPVKMTLAGSGGTGLWWHSTDPDVVFAVDSVRRFVSLDLSGRNRDPHSLMQGWQPPTPVVALCGTPDGKRLLLIDRAGLLVSFDPAVLGIVVTRDTELKDVCAMAIDRAGRRVAVADERGNVVVLESGPVPAPLPEAAGDAAIWQGEAWFEESPPFAVEAKDIRLDANGRPVLLTQHDINRTRKEIALRFHAERPDPGRGGTATVNLDEMIDPSGRVAGQSHAWQLQPDGEPMVIYRRNLAVEPYAGEIMLARRSIGGVWNARPISPTGGHGSLPVMHVRPDGAIDVFHFGYYGHYWYQTTATGQASQNRVLGLMGDGFRARLGTDLQGRHHFAFRMNKFNGEQGPPMYARLDGDAAKDVVDREPIDVRAAGCTHFWIGRNDTPTAVTIRERSHGSAISVVMRRFPDGWHEELLPAAFADILERPDSSLIAVTWDATEEDVVFWEQRGTDDWFPMPLRVKWPAAPNGLALRIDPQGKPVVIAIRDHQSPSWIRVISQVPPP